MTNRQYAQINCARATLEVVHEQNEILGAYEGIAAVVGRIEDKVIRIDELVEAQERDHTGITENKETARLTLINTVLAVCGQIRALGEIVGDADLRQRAADTRTEWVRVPQGKLAERTQSILQLARDHQTTLDKYGAIDQLLTTLEAQIKAFEDDLVKPRDGINRRKSITRMLGTECRALMSILRDELDPLMRQFETTHPKFHQDYHNARALVDLPVIPRERRDAARQRRADRQAEIAQRRTERSALAKQRKSGTSAPDAASTDGLTN